MITGFSSAVQGDEEIIASIQMTYNEMTNKGLDGVNGTMPFIVDTLASDNIFLQHFS